MNRFTLTSCAKLFDVVEQTNYLILFQQPTTQNYLFNHVLSSVMLTAILLNNRFSVRHRNLKCPNKSRDRDSFSEVLLKRCIDQLIHPITTIINMSMQDGVIPDDFKQAVNSLIKNQNLGKIN